VIYSLSCFHLIVQCSKFLSLRNWRESRSIIPKSTLKGKKSKAIKRRGFRFQTTPISLDQLFSRVSRLCWSQLQWCWDTVDNHSVRREHIHKIVEPWLFVLFYPDQTLNVDYLPWLERSPKSFEYLEAILYKVVGKSCSRKKHDFCFLFSRSSFWRFFVLPSWAGSLDPAAFFQTVLNVKRKKHVRLFFLAIVSSRLSVFNAFKMTSKRFFKSGPSK